LAIEKAAPVAAPIPSNSSAWRRLISTPQSAAEAKTPKSSVVAW